MKDEEKLLIQNKPIVCEKCKGKLFFMGGGRYQCGSCGHETLDDFGKVKEFLDKNGPSPAVIISEATGVDQSVINLFLKNGRVEITEDSPYFLKCEKCGCSLRYGRYCPECIIRVTGQITSIFNAEVGEKPKSANPSLSGNMHYISRDSKKRK